MLGFKEVYGNKSSWFSSPSRLEFFQSIKNLSEDELEKEKELYLERLKYGLKTGASVAIRFSGGGGYPDSAANNLYQYGVENPELEKAFQVAVEAAVREDETVAGKAFIAYIKAALSAYVKNAAELATDENSPRTEILI